MAVLTAAGFITPSAKSDSDRGLGEAQALKQAINIDAFDAAELAHIWRWLNGQQSPELSSSGRPLFQEGKDLW